MNKRVLYYALITSLGGLLFGFDTAVISGAEQSIKEVWHLSSVAHGFTNAIALIGTILGAFTAGWLGDRFGRRNMLVIIAISYLVSAIGSAVALNWLPFLIYRLLGGVAVGASSVLGPMYISEIAPSEKRGRLVAIFQFNIVLGIVVAYFSNYLIHTYVAEDSWRWMLGAEALPALIFFLLMMLVPKSPRWLVLKGLEEEAKKSIRLLVNSENKTNLMLESIKESVFDNSGENKTRLFARRYGKPILLVFLLATFNQFSGINAIMYYAPRIIESVGIAKDAAMLQVVLIGLTNMTFTLIAMAIIDKFGRVTLMKIGTFGMIISLGMTTYLFGFGTIDGSYLLLFIVLFIASFALSQGAVIWVFLSEIFPNSVRAKGNAFGSLVHWVWAAVITWTFPIIGELNNGGTIAFGIFLVAMILQLFFVFRMMPETRNKRLEEIEDLY